MTVRSAQKHPDDAGSVIQLLYSSRCQTGAASALEMSDILAEARPANARDGVTGVLTAVASRFVQVVEGPEAAIDRLLARLLRDTRHDDLVVLDRRRVERRAFGDWDLVSPRLAAHELGLLALLLDNPAALLDDYVAVLQRAVASQDAVLEGWGGPDPARPGSPSAISTPGVTTDPKA